MISVRKADGLREGKKKDEKWWNWALVLQSRCRSGDRTDSLVNRNQKQWAGGIENNRHCLEQRGYQVNGEGSFQFGRDEDSLSLLVQDGILRSGHHIDGLR